MGFPHSHFDDNDKPKLVSDETKMVANEEAEMIEKQDDEMVELLANKAKDNHEIDMVFVGELKIKSGLPGR